MNSNDFQGRYGGAKPAELSPTPAWKVVLVILNLLSSEDRKNLSDHWKDDLSLKDMWEEKILNGNMIWGKILSKCSDTLEFRDLEISQDVFLKDVSTI